MFGNKVTAEWNTRSINKNAEIINWIDGSKKKKSLSFKSWVEKRWINSHIAECFDSWMISVAESTAEELKTKICVEE